MFLARLVIGLSFVGVISNAASKSAWAGKVEQISAKGACVRAVYSGAPLTSGIHTGGLPQSAVVKGCNGRYVRVSIKNGKQQIKYVKKKHIPNFKSRSKQGSLKDGRLTIGSKSIKNAWLIKPTNRYDHGILGDRIEAGGLVIETAQGKKLEFLLSKKTVFEDRMARLVDLDGDGESEIVVMEASLNYGGSIAVFGVRGDKVVRIAQSPFIGLSHRWLNVAAASDFDGDGKVELAWVQTPHIGGILKVARLESKGVVGKTGKRNLEILDDIAGFSNHIIGSRVLLESATFDWDGDGLPDIILPGAARRTLQVVSFKGGKLDVIDEMPIDGRINSQLVAADLDGNGKGEVLIALKDGRLMSFSAE